MGAGRGTWEVSSCFLNASMSILQPGDSIRIEGKESKRESKSGRREDNVTGGNAKVRENKLNCFTTL